jgi:hypothetical protein
MGFSVLLERIYRTRSAEGEAFLVHYDLAETGIPGATFPKSSVSGNNLRLVNEAAENRIRDAGRALHDLVGAQAEEGEPRDRRASISIAGKSATPCARKRRSGVSTRSSIEGQPGSCASSRTRRLNPASVTKAA